MLINCPRCGFSQPQDQYCAQCGVDMQRYKPKEQPLLAKIFGNTAFQIIALLIATFFVGQYILNKPAPRKFVQRMIYPVSKSESVRVAEEETAQSARSQASENEEVDSSVNAGNSARESGGSVQENTAGATAGAGAAAKSALDPNTHLIRLSFVEVPVETINKWISESNNAGLYQSLTDYSVGILTDFRKQNDRLTELKTADLKILAGSSASNLSGVMNDDSTQLIGLTINVELKSVENETLLGSIAVNKTGPQGTESYPSEFELPKGSAFFLIGALKVENFQQDRTKLTMPPFQIFKSQDFMTRKTEFVIIVEPVYK